MEEKCLTRGLIAIAKDLRSKLDAYHRNTRDRKYAGKHQVKEEILTIERPPKQSEHKGTNIHIKVLPKNILNINFSLKDPRVPSWSPRDPLIITAYVHLKKIHRVLIDNGSNTDILYKHYFRQLRTS